MVLVIHYGFFSLSKTKEAAYRCFFCLYHDNLIKEINDTKLRCFIIKTNEKKVYIICLLNCILSNYWVVLINSSVYKNKILSINYLLLFIFHGIKIIFINLTRRNNNG